jgi:hypothetical protein
VAKATLTGVTLNDNSAKVGSSGIQQWSSSPVVLKNTIVASDPSGINCDATGSPAPIVSSGYNLSSDGTCASFFNHGGDLNNVYPDLDPLANNGGPTLTHRPEPTSPAIDAIPDGVNGCGTTLTADQRSVPRPINGRCDIGAVEYGAMLPWLYLPLVIR